MELNIESLEMTEGKYELLENGDNNVYTLKLIDKCNEDKLMDNLIKTLPTEPEVQSYNEQEICYSTHEHDDAVMFDLNITDAINNSNTIGNNTEVDRNEPLVIAETTVPTEPDRQKIKSQKLLKESGQPYTSKTKKPMPGKSLKENPCAHKKCQKSCGKYFSEENRKMLFSHYWNLNNDQQKCFVFSMMKQVPIHRIYGTDPLKKKSRTLQYFFPLNGEKIQVCRQFVLKTLDVSHKYLQYTFDNRNPTLNTPKPDQRGKKTPPNKTPITNRLHIIKFIRSLPAVPSHYCRKRTTKTYLPDNFRNLSNIYRLYKGQCKNENFKCVKEKIFRDIFNNEFNIGIHKPKKDKCNICVRYQDKSEPTREEVETYAKHLEEKEMTNKIFIEDQNRSKTINSFVCVSFDLQKVLNTPHGDNMLLYYSRKYSVYNFTLYESGSRNGYCYIWGKADGKRGANAICSIIYRYLRTIDAERNYVNEVKLYCDCCPGQNRNRQLLACLFQFVQTAKHIKSISVTYLLPGHTYMPADSMHATIESAYRKRIIWAPSEWPTIITNAPVNPNPYIVEVLDFKCFQDWKGFQQTILPNNMKYSLQSSQILFREIREVAMEQGSDTVKIKYFCNPEAQYSTVKFRQARKETTI